MYQEYIAASDMGFGFCWRIAVFEGNDDFLRCKLSFLDLEFLNTFSNESNFGLQFGGKNGRSPSLGSEIVHSSPYSCICFC